MPFPHKKAPDTNEILTDLRYSIKTGETSILLPQDPIDRLRESCRQVYLETGINTPPSVVKVLSDPTNTGALLGLPQELIGPITTILKEAGIKID